MTSIVCLAHFCEVHGPTPIMVTEGLPVSCAICGDHDSSDLMATVNSAASSGASSPATSAAMADALRKMSIAQPWLNDPRSAKPKSNSPTPRPRRPSEQQQQQHPPQSSSASATSNFRKTYDESVTRRAIPCDNCAMTLPQRKTPGSSSSSSNGGQSGSGSASGSATGATGAGPSDSRNPTLRSRVPCGRVNSGTPGDTSPPLLHPSSFSSASSSTSSDTEGEEALASRFQQGYNHHRRTGTMASAATSRSSTSSSRLANYHTHFLDYTSMHEPASANAYRIIRASCLRTLTLETLPRGPASAPGAGGAYGMASPPITPAPMAATSYFTSSPAGAAGMAAAAAAAASGGPLFFGDPAAGYTTAHVFRVADIHARGHKRVYALIALNTHRERLAMKAFGFISAAFSDMATWIQQMAEAEAERIALQAELTAASSPAGDSSFSASTSTYDFGGSPHVSPPVTQPSSVSNDSGSSFLVAAGNGLSRRMGPGFAGFGGLGSSTMASTRARGLPDILGRPDFFIELHGRFVRLLVELNMAMNQ